jgi:hypothetical protein
MQLNTFFRTLLATAALASYANAYVVKPDSAISSSVLDKRDNVNFVGSPAGGKICSGRSYSQAQISSAGTDAATRKKDGRLVPNPKNPNNNNPYPHQFRTQTLSWADGRCGSGQPNGELFEYPIFTNGLVSLIIFSAH